MAETTDTPEQVVNRCREAIEQDAPPEEKENLLAVTQVLTFLRYNDSGLLSLLGGSNLMIESPLIQEIVTQAEQQMAEKTAKADILAVLEARFGQVPSDLAEKVRSVVDRDQLNQMVRQAAACQDLEAFAESMP